MAGFSFTPQPRIPSRWVRGSLWKGSHHSSTWAHGQGPANTKHWKNGKNMISPGKRNSSTARQTQEGKSPSPNDKTCSKMQMSFPLKDTHSNRVDLQVEIQMSLLSQGLLGSCPTNSGTCRTPRHLPSSLAPLPGPSTLVTGCCPPHQHPNPSPAALVSPQAWV